MTALDQLPGVVDEDAGVGAVGDHVAVHEEDPGGAVGVPPDDVGIAVGIGRVT
jgi:hypothetical protein